jgi:hypothetical protein
MTRVPNLRRFGAYAVVRRSRPSCIAVDPPADIDTTGIHQERPDERSPARRDVLGAMIDLAHEEMHLFLALACVR